MDYRELRDKADRIDKASSEKAIDGYHYARSKGFTARESTLLQYKSKDEIDRIAEERDNNCV
jgi:hypothetical protein